MKSNLFSSARARVLEKKLLNFEDIDKLKDVRDFDEALERLREKGFGTHAQSSVSASDDDLLDALCANETAYARELLSELAPDEKLSEIFLLKSDIVNLKRIIKMKLFGNRDEEPLFDPNGTIEPPVLEAMVKNDTYFGLPEVVLETLKNLPEDPSQISISLDRAYYTYALAASAEISKELHKYFKAIVDIVNLDTLFRFKNINIRFGKAPESISREALILVLMPEGDISFDKLYEALKAPDESLHQVLCAGVPIELSNALKPALTAKTDDDRMRLLEELKNTYPESIIKTQSVDMESVFPVLELYFKRLAVVRYVRRVMVVKYYEQ